MELNLGMQEFFSILKSINVIYLVNKPKNKNHIIILVDTVNTSDQIKHPIMIKTQQASRALPQPNSGN